MSKVHLQVHENGFTCCGPNNGHQLEATEDKTKVTCIKGQYRAGLIPSPYTGPKNRRPRSWTWRIARTIKHAAWKHYDGVEPDYAVMARNVMSLLKSGGWRRP